jgi:hypothetical protein
MSLRLVPLLLVLTFAAPPVATAGDVEETEVEGFEARFEQIRVIPGLSRPFEAEGRLRWRQGGRLDWHTEKPLEYSYHLDAERLSERMPDGSRRELDAGDAPWIISLNRLLAALVGGDRDLIAEMFDVEPHEEGHMLRPRDEALADLIAGIHVIGEPFPEYLRIEETDGGFMEIRLDERRVLAADRDGT